MYILVYILVVGIIYLPIGADETLCSRITADDPLYVRLHRSGYCTFN